MELSGPGGRGRVIETRLAIFPGIGPPGSEGGARSTAAGVGLKLDCIQITF